MQADALQRYGSLFAEMKSRFDRRLPVCDGLFCKQGFYMNSVVLKLQKACWTNDRMDVLKNESGIFFSIWVNEQTAGKNRANYNIHALKLRHLDGFSIASREFSKDFRKQFAPLQDFWPNVSLKYGPLTLMQGWIEVNADNAEGEISFLMERFEEVCPIIDRLLELRRR